MNYFLGSYILQKKLELLIKECCEKTDIHQVLGHWMRKRHIQLY